jgi:hypothetical protein
MAHFPKSASCFASPDFRGVSIGRFVPKSAAMRPTRVFVIHTIKQLLHIPENRGSHHDNHPPLSYCFSSSTNSLCLSYLLATEPSFVPATFSLQPQDGQRPLEDAKVRGLLLSFLLLANPITINLNAPHTCISYFSHQPYG